MQTVSLPTIDDLPELYPAVVGVDWDGATGPEPVHCPRCDVNASGSNCHPSAVRVWPLTDAGLGVEITARGVLFFRQERVRGAMWVRGVVITIRYDCELGHHFEERRQFHKGDTFRDVAEVACECHAVDTIWRD